MDWAVRMILLFMIYSFLGWCCETVFCSIIFRRFDNRGFLNGPFCPIYAVGAFAIVWLAQAVPHNIALIFGLGLVSTSLVEYLTGTLLELIFKTRYWDYSDQKFNIQGRVCLKNSLLFGAMSVGLVFFLHPAVTGLIGRIPRNGRIAAAAVFLAYFAADLAVTVATVLKLNRRLKSIHAGMLAIKEKLDTVNFYNSFAIRERMDKLYEFRNNESFQQIYRVIEHLTERVRGIELDNRVLQRRLLNAFPNIRSVRYPEYLNNIKTQLAGLRKRRL